MNDDIFSFSKEFSTVDFLCLISASAVLRKEKFLRRLFVSAKERSINRRKIYEALLQTYLFAGFPSALISLSIFNEYFPGVNSLRSNNSNIKFKVIGEVNCRKIYGDKFEKLIENISAFSPELAEWLVSEGYGKVFGRKHLTLKERELINVSILAALKFSSQLYSHINGAYRFKATLREIRHAIAILSCTGKKDYEKFGLRVLEKFLKQKGAKPKPALP